ncbi:hypothetical protein EV359DRAFT_35770, partial [Lentinula novae-zelandiae]
EYETGRIDCPSCHKQVAFRDEETGEFSLKRWQQHWDLCLSESVDHRSKGALRPDDLFPSIMAHPPTKRRRAKRTEEERITYLDADPYVAKFEAYRVLCASCDKWIRLRPNSTYCSIPWDAHRKSCLSKKISNKNTYALDERNSLFSKDPDVRKFDAERVLCAVCDRWIPINSEDHLQAVQTWLNHRGDCAKRAAAVVDPESDLDGSNHIRVVDLSRPPSGQIHIAETHDNDAEHSTSIVLSLSHQAGSVAPPLDTSAPSTEGGSQSEPIMYSPAAGIFPPGPAHESRRRNAEQRAATLRADTLIKHVEPNRVFCSLCEKWVQLRQDSSFCAYPWFQHRGKCLARYQRRAQKAAEIEDIKKRRTTSGTRPHPHNGGEEDELAYFSGSDQGRSDEDDIPFNYRGLSASASPVSEGRSVSVGSRREREYIGEYMDSRNNRLHAHSYGGKISREKSDRAHQGHSQSRSHGPYGNGPLSSRTSGPASGRGVLADLDSHAGRKQFVSHSIAYLFQTTYDCSPCSSDELSISALVAYLNAAMPMDKHEDFDTAEVVRCVGALREKGRVLLEGDVVRKVRKE